MVKKPTNPKSSKKSAGKKAAGKAGAKAAGEPRRQVIDAAFALALEQGWRDLSLAEIAEAAGLPLSEVYPLFPSKQAILDGFSREVDAQMLAEGSEGLDSPARDRLFDMVMRRFDALQPYKEALGVILQDQLRDPLAACCGLGRLGRSMAATLEAAGFSTTGCRGVLRVKGLAAIYLSTVRVWLRDDSEDMAATMAHLDKQLSRIDNLVGRLKSYRPGRDRSGHAAA
ncbi:TetR family transcriptional regulator [Pelagibius sp. 7325]|uniref:TetR family transcriptional regulator n=1 Tax=Pelagibius sp. 7325 TaxID=3131994 RepID=UPI0030EE8894